VFESSVRVAILAGSKAQLLSALSSLVPGVYTAVDQIDATDSETAANSLANDFERLSLQSRRVEFASLLLLYHLVNSDSSRMFHDTLMALTSPTRSSLRTPFSKSSSHITPSNPPFLSRNDLRYSIAAYRSLGPSTFCPVAYTSLLMDKSASPYERILLCWTKDRAAERTVSIVKKAYMEVSLEWASRLVGYDESQLRESVAKQGGRVEGDRIKLR
jgi:hypothetical protein